ncbi:SRPBCC family protein [Roseivivax sp. CAU 1761]
MQITVETLVKAPPEEVWRAWTTPEDICAWNAASPDWHTPRAEIDLRAGGRFCSRMEARDGSAGFDFEGVFEHVEPQRRIESRMDGRRLVVEFLPEAEGTRVRETFDADEVYPPEAQRAGWQAILDNFARHVEGR